VTVPLTIAEAASLSARETPGERMLTFNARAMGSPLRLSLAPVDPGSGDYRSAIAAWDAVRAEFEASEQALSRFRDTSDVTVLNRAIGRSVPPSISWRLRRALIACDRANRVTDGRFDPRVLSDLERLGDRGAPLGSVAGEAMARHERPAGRIVEWSAAGLRLPIAVDLGGIGKGLALRWAAAVVQKAGVTAFLLDAGGDLVTRGKAPDGEPWRIGVEDPRGGSEPLAVLRIADEAVATSSVRRRAWQSGERMVHHLIDPATGEPGGAGLLAVTVAGGDPAWAEIWSKSLFLEGRDGIAALARRRGLAAWWITEDGSLEMTAAARVRTSWMAAES
jgi:thiamine biosynthesis lipoprotein